MTLTPHDERVVHETVAWVSDALQAMPDREQQFFLKEFPTGSCDIASFVIGHVLTDLRVGTWRVVTYETTVGRTTRHTWLELATSPEEAPFTIDATIHQFRDLTASPFVGYGRSPAQLRFSRLLTSESFSALSEGRWDKPMFTDPLMYVRSLR
ncbi:hypothetical protein J3D46_002954 [Paenarthrobacter sp. A20]|nr:hypothetical protein [Paenarthrobacter sp. A20]